MDQPGEDEVRTLDTVRHAFEELCTCLNSLGGKQSSGLFDNFMFKTAAYAKETAEGYIALREHGGIQCSKLFVRPLIELMLRMRVVAGNPPLLYRIVRTDWNRY